MDLTIITIKQVFILFILIFAGFLCVKLGILKQEAKKAFSDLLIYLIVPAMIIHSYMIDFDTKVLKNLLTAFGLSAVLLLLGLAITLFITAKMKDSNRPILRFACIFSNAAYMGFPLIKALFGDEGMIYASAFVTVFNILLWTVGYAMVSGQVKPKEVIHSICTTPVLISVLIGIIIYMCQIPIPDIIEQPLDSIGSMNTPLSMIITGMIIANSTLADMVSNKKIMLIIFVRMLVIPIVCFGVMLLIGVHGMVAEIVLLLECCPSAAITSVFAVQFDYDEKLAAGAVVLTTFISIITLPVCALLLTMFL